MGLCNEAVGRAAHGGSEVTLPDTAIALLSGVEIVLVVLIVRALRRIPKQSPIKGEVLALRLLANCGPLFVHELERFGVEDAAAVVDALAWNRYVVSEPVDGGLLYALTPAGQRRARQGAI